MKTREIPKDISDNGSSESETAENKVSSIKKIREVIRVLFPIAAKRFPFFYPLMACKTLLDVLMPFLGVWLTPLIVDELTGARDVQKLILYAALLVGGECILTVLRQLAVTRLNKYNERLDNYFEMCTGAHTMQLDYQLTEDKEALDQLEKANTGMGWYSGGVYGISEQFFMFAGNILKIAGYITVIALHAPLLLAVCCVCVIVSAWMTTLGNKVEVKAYEGLAKTNRIFSYFGWETVDFKYGKDIRLYDASDMLLSRWDQTTDTSIGYWKWQARAGMKYRLVNNEVSIFGTLFTYGYAAWLALNKVFSLGVFSQMVEATSGLNSSLNDLAINITELFKRCGYAYEFVIFMNYPEVLPKGDLPVSKGLHTIEFRNVSFSYPGSDKKVLDGVNLRVDRGERLSLVGLNGAGKTTLIKLLCRLYDPDEGQILLDGTDIREYDPVQYHAQFAPVFQDFSLFAFSLAENICLKAEKDITDADRERILSLVERTGLSDMVDHLPNGIDTNLFHFFDKQGVDPSGGEKQKIALARALYKDGSVIILDEPTAALDPIAEYEIYKSFNDLIEDKTAFYISHRLSSCRFCDHIAVFSEGKVAEYGTHDDLVAKEGGLYAAMFEAQAQYYK